MITSIVLTPGQYAYIRDHSSETLLIKKVNDIFIAADGTTASGDALCWSTSSSLVLTCNSITLGKSASETITVRTRVPQGPVLDPDLFNITSLYSLFLYYWLCR